MDLRRHSRKPLALSLQFSTAASEPHVAAQSRDISLGGMFIETDSPPPFGTRLTIKLRLASDERTFTLDGIVRWTTSEGVGVQFGTMGAHETHAIMEALATNK